MKLQHVIKRGSRYQFVCRIPQDLINLFPSPVIYCTLHSKDEKNVRLPANPSCTPDTPPPTSVVLPVRPIRGSQNTNSRITFPFRI